MASLTGYSPRKVQPEGRGAFHLASYAADNVLREFFFRTITSKLPGYQKKPSSESVSGEANSQTKEEPIPRQADR